MAPSWINSSVRRKESVANALIAQLRGHLVASGHGAQLARLAHVLSERLLQIHVFAAFQGRRGDHGVRMDRRGDYHGVDLTLHGVEHTAEIAVGACRGQQLRRCGQLLLVHVAEGHNILADSRKRVDQRPAAAHAQADLGQI
jgi:hypothetical protein